MQQSLPFTTPSSKDSRTVSTTASQSASREAQADPREGTPFGTELFLNISHDDIKALGGYLNSLSLPACDDGGESPDSKLPFRPHFYGGHLFLQYGYLRPSAQVVQLTETTESAESVQALFSQLKLNRSRSSTQTPYRKEVSRGWSTCSNVLEDLETLVNACKEGPDAYEQLCSGTEARLIKQLQEVKGLVVAKVNDGSADVAESMTPIATAAAAARRSILAQWTAMIIDTRSLAKSSPGAKSKVKSSVA